ncbi:MAG: prepilin-type N-terminal cleavage/methylation domain-containing protein [Candidatus Kaiserbacteria bacterium]|nr:prepilin-type N-terminal cleavage/methylation domain-containing protein [Candidatus Kaiserbacteria bacterium]
MDRRALLHPAPDTALTRGLPAQAGFTLIELITVMAIMVLISGLILSNNSLFSGKVELQNLAYDIGLSIRQAQVYGISVERFATGVFAGAYGVHFDTSNRNTYVLFADVLPPINGVYDCPTPGSNCELVLDNTIRSGYTIAQLCATPAGGSESCVSAPTSGSLDITFQRPEPDAFIRASWLPGINETGRIILQSARGDTRSVVVEVNGQIAVQ